jgi:hypothetical protein
MRKIIFGILLNFLALHMQGQSITVTPFSFDDDLRFLKLQGKLPEKVSLNIRPMGMGKEMELDSLYRAIADGQEKPFKPAEVKFLGKYGKAGLLPITTINKFTSHHPYGWSDGALFPANGFQSLISAGAYFKLGPLSIQLRPELLYAENKPYELSQNYGADKFKGAYRTLLPGQSRIALDFGPVSLAASSENLWWGPGQFSAVMMSNNAPGFPHISFSTNRPLKTAIGTFEWQIVGGEIRDIQYQPDEYRYLSNYNDVYVRFADSVDNKKYMNGVGLSYQPAFLKGVTVGVTRTFVSSVLNINNNLIKNEGFTGAYLPILGKLFKDKYVDDNARKWNQLASLFLRINFPKSNAEAYVEYGWNDHKWNIRDMMMSPTHSAAYLVGVKKLFKLRRGRTMDVSLEHTQMEQSPDFLVRDAYLWYIHWFKSDYSHASQVLGSGIGFGANAFTVSIVMKKGYNQIGLIIERVQRDPKFYATRWTDFSLGIVGRKKINNFLLNTRISGIQSINYAWEGNKNRFNIMGLLGVSYFF